MNAQPNTTSQTISADIVLIDPALVDPNRFQPESRRIFTPEQLADLNSIQDKGLLHEPRVRVSEKDPQRFECIDGWRRTCAWKLYRPGERMPVKIVARTDQEAFAEMIIENHQRLDLNPIQKGNTLLWYIKEFKATQEEAGKLFGGMTQASVSNLIRIVTQLPLTVQEHVASGEIPESIARRLIPVARVAESKELEQTVARVIKSDPDEREDTVLELIDDLIEDKGFDLNSVPWPLSGWPKSPVMSGTVADASKGEPMDMQIGACKGCEAFIESNYSKTCVRGVCWRLKARLYARGKADERSKALGIAVQTNGEKVTRIPYKGFDDLQWAQKVIASKKAQPLLRLLPSYQKLDESTRQLDRDYQVEKLTGSQVVGLGTVDLAAVDQIVKRRSDGEEGVPSESASAQEKKLRDKAAKEHREETREKNEIDRLVAAATKVLASTLPKGLILEILVKQADASDASGYIDLEWYRSWRWEEKQLRKLGDAERQQIVMCWLLNEHVNGYHFGSSREQSIGKVRAEIEAMARGLKTKLTKDWDAEEITPRLQKHDRCWHCAAEHGGRGGEGEVVSQVDAERGWVVVGNAKEPDDLMCPECAKERQAETQDEARSTKTAKATKATKAKRAKKAKRAAK